MANILGYDKHDPAGQGSNSWQRHRTKTVLTEIGPVDIDVPRHERVVRSADSQEASTPG